MMIQRKKYPERIMYRKLRISLQLIISCILLVLCVRFRVRATESPVFEDLAYNNLHDPWRRQILEDRSFSTLIVSIRAEGGVCTDCELQNREGEEKIQIFIYDQDGVPLITQNAGIRLSGATSREAARKSYRIVARKEYDKKHPVFTCDLWNGRHTLDDEQAPIQEYSSFVLHSMRQAMDATGIHNSVGYALARKAGILDASPTTPAALYINGVYQGAYFILPSKNDVALAELYNIEEVGDIETVSVFDYEKTGVQSAPEILEAYTEFVNYIQSADLSDPSVAARVEQQLDVHQCLQYYAVNLLLGNGDWLDNNLRVWRCKDNGLPCQDGKWRFFLFDLDWIGSFPELVSLNFETATQDDSHYNILPGLLKNPDYLALFKQIIAQMEQDAFCPEVIEAVFALEEARMYEEAAYDFGSDAFSSYMLYSVNSSPVAKEDYLTLEDRAYLVQDFKNHLLKTPEIINSCLETLP